MIPVISVSNLTKDYKDKRVVNSVSFSLFSGQIFGFVGPNGAGKSTTIKMILGLVAPTAGSISICDRNFVSSKTKLLQNVGAVVETPTLYSYLSGLANLKLFAKFYGKSALKNVDEIVKLVGMENRIKDKVSTYSLGMKQRLGIAQALLNKPKLLILDEPTNGLDPDGIAEIRILLKHLAKKANITILISSHNLAELEQTCDMIGFLNKGKLVDLKTMEQIETMLESKQQVQLSCNYPNYAGMLVKKQFNVNAKVVGNSIVLPIKEKNLATLISYLTIKRVKIYKIKRIQHSLEELYFELLNKTRPSSSII